MPFEIVFACALLASVAGLMVGEEVAGDQGREVE